MPRYAPAMQTGDLVQILTNLALANDYAEEYGAIDPANPDMGKIVRMLLQEDLLPGVVKDWSKISFSTENLEVVSTPSTPDGIPYLSLMVGGDWETPLVAIVYFDGKTLRGFVPKNGNPYNHRQKSAFGNHPSDEQAALDQCGHVAHNGRVTVVLETTAITDEINARLEAKGTHTLSAKPVVSKAAKTARAQARIEKGQNLSGPLTASMVYAVIELAAGGSYVSFKLRSSKRKLTLDEGKRVVGVPALLKPIDPKPWDDEMLWYAPSGCYPLQTYAILQAAGFEKAPDNDLTRYADARTIVVRL